VAACRRSAYGFVKSAAVPPTLALSTETRYVATLALSTQTHYVATLALNTGTHTLRGDNSAKHTDTHVTWRH